MGRQKMGKIKKYTLLVLEEYPDARNSDDICYMRVLKALGCEINNVPLSFFLLNRKHTSFPPYESVSRARRMIQSEREDLSASKLVKAMRAECEEEMRGWAFYG